MLYTLYQKGILKYPLTILLLLLIAIFSFSINTLKLEIDASSETLLLDDDKDLAFTRTIEKRFGGNDVLILICKPNDPLLSPKTLGTLEAISKELEALPLVSSVDSILNVPLLFSPIRDVDDLIHETRTLQSADMNYTMAKHEFLTSPLYKDRLVNKTFTMTSLLINLKPDTTYTSLLEKRNHLRQEAREHALSAQEQTTLKEVTQQFKEYRDQQRVQNTNNIHAIRALMQKYQSSATFYLGGVQMISNDIIDFVKNDLAIYGSILVFLLILVLGVVFRRARWVTLPILICTLSVLAITSSLGFFGWEITVISSNFITLQLIITISIVLHLIVRYEELLTRYPGASAKRLILVTILSKISPTFFAIITTVAGFSSLLFSHIHPVINLGWMMSAGISISLVIAFVVFPTVLMLLKKQPPLKRKASRFNIPALSSHIVRHDTKAIYLTTLIIILFSLTGASQLIVENSFINYFKKDTSIYQGMKIIDQEFGGTTPLDIILTFQETGTKPVTTASAEEEEDSFEDEFDSLANEEQYWFTDAKLAIIKKVHTYLAGLKQIGNVQSFDTLLETGKMLNHNEPLDSVELALLYQKLPQKYRDIILTPYVDIAHNQVRFSTRIVDSDPSLRRDVLIHTIKQDLSAMIDPKVATVQLSNLMVLYNNMLQSLFSSQIATLSYVLLILFVIFLPLFRSLRLTLIALVSNIIPIGMIFGFMGWMHIPLDIMTITIAAIAMGIGVDDTIHYIHRFKVEFQHDKDYLATMQRSTMSIGNAMYYTSLTIMIGFSILVLSNLIPTIYFGILTMLVMFAALVSNMILLPKLLLWLKPLR